jgi:hypothetical protein
LGFKLDAGPQFFAYVVSATRTTLAPWLIGSARLNVIPLTAYSSGAILTMSWEIEYTDAFGHWWDALSEGEQEAVTHYVRLLESQGPRLGFPYSSRVSRSKHRNMRELRVQHEGRPYRVLYAFDPRRVALLLIGGNKAGNDRWYDQFVPQADRLYQEHLVLLGMKGPPNG